MDIQNNQQPAVESSKKSYWKFVIGFLAILLVAGGSFLGWNYYRDYKDRKETEVKYKKVIDWQNNYEKAMKEDIYGGKTPQETLNMFVEALRKGDIELASKYFSLNGALNQSEWKIKIQDNQDYFLENALKAVPTPNQEKSDSTFWFSVYNNNGDVGKLIELSFNKQSNVWKIENL